MQIHLAVDSAKSRRQLYILLDLLCITNLDVRTTKLEELIPSFYQSFLLPPFPIDNRISNVSCKLATLGEKIMQPCCIVLRFVLDFVYILLASSCLGANKSSDVGNDNADGEIPNVIEPAAVNIYLALIELHDLFAGLLPVTLELFL
uniref:Uncharacterized protein n=1 Tax=Opuntia streptacantha TaxID=393608 RepID=A0A7C9ERN8_OPUST